MSLINSASHFMGDTAGVTVNFTADFRSWAKVNRATVQTNGKSLDDMLAAEGLDYVPLKVQARYTDPVNGQVMDIPDRFAVVNPGNGQYLGIVGADYTPVNYGDICREVYGKMTESGYIPARILSFDNGARIFIAMIAPDDYKVGDRPHSTFTAISSGHNGGTVIAVGDTDYCPVCQNTYKMALAEVKESGKRTKHTKNVYNRLGDWGAELFTVETVRRQYYVNLQKMIETPVNSDTITQFLSAMVPDGNGDKRDSKAQDNRRIEIMSAILKTQADDNRSKPTAYDLFGGVTDYVTHRAQKRDDNAQFDYVMSGSGAKLSNLAYAWALEATK
jgi:phage/plasmid-like protein (TIGR03299 family)